MINGKKFFCSVLSGRHSLVVTLNCVFKHVSEYINVYTHCNSFSLKKNNSHSFVSLYSIKHKLEEQKTARIELNETICEDEK